ncbi:MAG: 23S rRNA (guanosine(2251)-2'-O)-methyltransferase RlmB [Mycoplasmatales bacterium]
MPYVFVQRQYLDKLSDYQNHQGIIAISSPKELIELEQLIIKNQKEKNPMILMLDEVQDPQNLGAIIRIADAFNINGIIINKRRSVQLTSTVAQVSTGAINYVDICRVNNLRQAIKDLKKQGYFFAFLDMEGEQEVNQADYNLPLVVIIGGEDKGVTASIKKECDFGITIKQSGHVNSLNVASATSILCYNKNISR